MSPSRPGRKYTLATAVAGLVAAPLAVVTITAAPANAAPVDIQILATNDFHGRLADRPTGSTNPEPIEIASVMSGAVKELRDDNPNTVFSAAGDLIGASTFESFIQNDKPTIDALNEAGLEVSAAGNHEFDQGYDDLVNRVMAPYDATTNPEGGAGWEYIAANVRKKSDNSHALGPDSDRWIKDFGDVEVGFVGAVTEDLPSLVSPSGIADIEVTNIVEEVNASADVLESEGADVIVLLVHEGAPDTSLASATSNANAFGRIVNGVDANIDAIVSGHTHLAYNHSVPVPAWVTEGRPVTERPVVSAGQYGANLNQLVFSVETDPDADPTTDDVQVTAKTQAVLPMFGPDPDGSGPLATPPLYPVDAPTKEIVDAAFAEADVLGAQVLGRLAGPFNRAKLSTGSENRGGESSLGNLVAEVQRWATSSTEAGSAQIAFMNPGGLRADMVGNATGGYPADLTYKQAAVVQPFANTLVNMRMTGAQIKTLLEQQWQRDSSGAVPSRPFLRLGTSAGFRFTYDPARAEGDRITGMWLNGTRVASTTSYSVTANSFLASGGDNFRAFNLATSKRDTGKVDLEAMVDYAATQNPVAAVTDQHAVGVSFPAGAPAAYLPGDTVTFGLSSLAYSTPADAKDATVSVSLGQTALGSFPVDNTIGTAVFDEYGTATVSVKVPAGTAAGAATLKVTGATTGTTVDVPVTIGAVTPPPTPEPLETDVAVKTVPKRVVVDRTRVKVIVKVRADEKVDEGRVRLRIKGRMYQAKVDNGRAVFRIGRFAERGFYKGVAIYRGTDDFDASRDNFKIRVKRR
ncbi:bifunctional metallophosphatase/5'-nucleotidase [Nocardioides terrigena]|uniref:bifunctional metallophosphatase/5'-nucleotidase n=1 Tax=Nocardioides terrigena TaxID=424797 RepID=UPI00190101D0|nr:bifunctional UDP-sugar hydrolase/5'-nucleotidase [Nocardioides terrigena]